MPPTRAPMCTAIPPTFPIHLLALAGVKPSPDLQPELHARHRRSPRAPWIARAGPSKVAEEAIARRIDLLAAVSRDQRSDHLVVARQEAFHAASPILAGVLGGAHDVCEEHRRGAPDRTPPAQRAASL